MSLTPGQLEKFNTDGVIELGPVLDAADVREAQTRFGQVFERLHASENKKLRNLFAASDKKEDQDKSAQRHYQLYNIFQHDEWFNALLYRKTLLDRVESVLGPNIQLLHDQVFYKPARDGAPSDWHQDNSYWGYKPPKLCSIWIALDDVDLENSCLHFVPGSHREPSPPQKSFKTPTGVEIFKLQIDESRLKSFPMPAGHAVMHDCMTIHGAYPNRSARPRRALGIHYLQTGLRRADGKTPENLAESPVLRGHVPQVAAV